VEIHARYTYAQTAVILGLSPHTVRKWVQIDAEKAYPDRRLPGAVGGWVPLAAIKSYTNLTTDDLRALDVDLAPAV
jgi:hypothetical protein